MNWVGGSRNRLVMKTNAKKQKEYFEKIKMQQKLTKLGVALPASPRAPSSSGSVDLLTLFIVNQIAAKKENKDSPKVAVFGSSNGASRQKRNEPLVLPMSPGSPSRLSLVESQPQYSQGSKRKKIVIPQDLKCQQLSPVMESAFSDNSASDYVPRSTNTSSPFSSTSSASSAQGIFPQRLNLQQQYQTPSLPLFSPPPWDTSVLQHTKFQPFSQTKAPTDSWSREPNPPFFQLQTPAVARNLFRSPQPDESVERDRAGHGSPFSLNQSEDTEPAMDFLLNQAGTEEQFEDVFEGFSTAEREGGASRFEKSKMYLRDETPIRTSTAQTVPDSAVELSSCTDVNFACLGQNSALMNYCENLPSGEGYLSSDSSDDEECCQPCLQASASYMDQPSTPATTNTNHGSQSTPNARIRLLRPPTPYIKSKINFKDEQKVTENIARQTGCRTSLLFSPLTQSLNSEVCKCKKTSTDTRETGTQTGSAVEMCDASIQCSWVTNSENKPPWFRLHVPNVELSQQHPATRRQSDTAAETNPLPASQESSSREARQTPWRKKEPQAASMSDNSTTDTFAATTKGKLTLQGAINTSLDAGTSTNNTGNPSEDARDERGHHESNLLMKDLSDQAGEEEEGEREEEATSATRANKLSVANKALREIADILLLLNQRRRE